MCPVFPIGFEHCLHSAENERFIRIICFFVLSITDFVFEDSSVVVPNHPVWRADAGRHTLSRADLHDKVVRADASEVPADSLLEFFAV